MKLHQHSIGSGPDLVMLHGWGLHSGIWFGNEYGLADQLSRHYRVTMIDLPGHGLSNAFNDGFSLNTAIRAITATLPATAILLGWSLGGLLALQLSHQLPQRISRLILIGSTARFTRAHDWPAAMPAVTLQGFGSALCEDTQSTVQRFLALQVRGSDNERQQLRTLKLALNQRPAARPAALASGLDILSNADIRPLLPQILPATFLLHGQHDRIVPAAASTTIATMMPQASSLIINGAGHAPFLSHPEQTGQAILDFLND